MRSLLVALILLAAGGALPARACLRPPPQAPNSAADNAGFAAAMVAQAAHVEIVEVADQAPFADPELWRDWLQRATTPPPPPEMRERLQRTYEARRSAPVGTHYRLRVVRRLKGSGPAIIGLDGGYPSPKDRGTGGEAGAPQPPLEHWTGGAPTPFVFMPAEELSARNLTPLGCQSGPIEFGPHARYLIFRGADGHLLGPVRFPGVEQPVIGYRLVRLARGGPQDWLSAVEQATAALGDRRRAHAAPPAERPQRR